MHDSSSERWYLPLLGNNLVGMMTGGILMPAWGLAKYYDDIQSLAPGRLILSSAGVRSDWFHPGEDGEVGTPVAVEVDYQPIGGSLGTGRTKVVALEGVLPAHLVTVVHFQTAQREREFLARKYRNFNPSNVCTSVSPDLFTSEHPPLQELDNWLSHGQPESRLTPTVLRSMDRFAGLLFMLLIQPAGSCSELQVRSRVLRHLLGTPASEPVVNAVVKALSIPQWMSVDPVSDAKLLESIANVLNKIDPESVFGPRRLLADVWDSLKVSGQESAVSRNLARVETILRAQARLPILNETDGLRSAKALLLYLLRSAPSQVVSWVPGGVGDPLAALGASAFSGFGGGLRPVPTDMRKVDICRLVTGVAADRANGARSDVSGAFVPRALQSVSLLEDPDLSKDGRILRVGQVEVCRSVPDRRGDA